MQNLKINAAVKIESYYC